MNEMPFVGDSHDADRACTHAAMGCHTRGVETDSLGARGRNCAAFASSPLYILSIATYTLTASISSEKKID